MNGRKARELRERAKSVSNPTEVATINGAKFGGSRVELVGERKVYKGLKEAVKMPGKRKELWPNNSNSATNQLRRESLRTQ